MTEPGAVADESVRAEISESSGVRRTLEVEVDAQRVQHSFERAYRDLAQRARVRGFRPGKVPRAVLERLYAGAIAEEVERTLVAQTLPEALRRTGVRPLTEPAVETRTPSVDAAFRYTARVEVKPEIVLPELRGLPGRRPRVEVGAEEVQRELEALRLRRAPILEEPEGTALAPGHIATLDFAGRIGGKPFEGGSGENVSVEIGSERFLPGFEEQIVGARAGDDLELRVKLPEDHGNPALAGQEALFAVHVVAVRRRQLPELDDEFAKDLGEFASLLELRTRIESELRAARERDAQGALRRSLLDALGERAPFEVPAGLTERALQRRLASAHRQLEKSVAEDALHAQLARWQEEWRPLAEREVRDALLLEAVAQSRGFVAEDAEVEARIEAMSREQGVDPVRLRKAYQEANLLEAVRVQILDEKAIEHLCGEARVEEVSSS